MAHFAKIGINGTVMNVVPFDDNKMLDADNNENEEVGRAALEAETGWPLWKQCSYNTHEGVHSDSGTAFRANYPAIGDYYNEVYDIFHEPKPIGCDSWTLDTTKGRYVAPTAMPAYADSTYTSDSVTYKYQIMWNDTSQKWEGFNDAGDTKLAIWNGSSWDAV